MLTEEQVRESLKAVIDPELKKDIVTLGMVRAVDFHEDGHVHVTVSLTTPGCPIRAHFEQGVAQAVRDLEGVERVSVDFDVLSADEKQGLQKKLGRGNLPEGSLAQVANVVCVGSGKGGVGKSTVTTNLAAALWAEGKQVATMDADVWGYSIPRMLGIHGKPKVTAERKIVPLVAHGGIKAISIEFFLEEQDQAITWRGPMLHKAIRQFLEDVDWGELDYLLIDLPPGTGDVSMTLAQLLPQAQMAIVTTPQPAAQQVAGRAAEMARRFDLGICGVIENMSPFTTPSGERITMFGEGGGQELADKLDVPLLGKVPLQEELRIAADEGEPLVLRDPDAPAAQAIRHAARGLIAAMPDPIPQSAPPVEVTGTPLPMAPVTAAGAVEGIYISPEAESLPVSVAAATAQPGVGLEGDRYAEGNGTFSETPGTGRALTLVEAEVLDGLDPPLAHAEARRNLVTRGVRLNDLVGKRFIVGEVELEGMRLCEPCADLEREVGREGLMRELAHKGGLRADIRSGGTLKVGDPVA